MSQQASVRVVALALSSWVMACSSSSGGAVPVVDSGATDTGTADMGSDAPTTPGTTGSTCATDTDCDPDGLYGSQCWAYSNTTHVCLGGACDTALVATPCDQNKGYCLVEGAATTLCIAGCDYDFDGTWTRKCPTGITCVPSGVMNTNDDGSWKSGRGFCEATACQADSDCPMSAPKCQVESGSCVPSSVHRTYTSKIGDACKVPAAGVGTDCFCFGQPGKAGYCMTLCTTGGPACPSGTICSATLPKTDDGGKAAFTAQANGLSGYCVKGCAVDADCSSITGGAYCDTSIVGSGICRVGTKP